MSQNPTLLIIRGIPGSGKSTIAQALLKSSLFSFHCEADNYFIGTDGVYRFNPNEIQQAHEDCQRAVKEAMQTGRSVIVSNTTTKQSELEIYLDLARYYHYSVQEMVLRSDWCDVHNVPDRIKDKMKQRLKQSLTNW